MDMRAIPLFIFGVALVGCGKGGSMAEDRAATAASAKAEMPVEGVGGFRSAASGEAVRLASNPSAPPEVPRLIVRNGDLSLRVGDIRKGESAVGNVARSVGGAIEASQGTDLAGPSPSLSITLRVPESRFDLTISRLEGLGTRLGKTISSEDVTAQAVDLDARLKSLRVQEDAYRAILGAARKISDVLEVQERLTGVRTEIEQIVAQRRNLGDQASRSKIVVSLSQALVAQAAPVEPDWASQTWGQATGSLRAFGRGLAQLGIWLTAMLPVWLPLTLIGLFAYRRMKVAEGKQA